MAAIPDPTNLRQVALFRDMGLSELAVLNGLMRRQVFPAGMRIVVTEQLEDTAYVIWTGVVKVVIEQADFGAHHRRQFRRCQLDRVARRDDALLDRP
jgi:CRP-like cAMP-binding protein